LLPTHTVWDRGRVGAETDWTEACVVLSQVKGSPQSSNEGQRCLHFLEIE